MYSQLNILLMCEDEIKKSNLAVTYKQRIMLEIISAKQRFLQDEYSTNSSSDSDLYEVYNQIKHLCNLSDCTSMAGDTHTNKIVGILETSKKGSWE